MNHGTPEALIQSREGELLDTLKALSAINSGTANLAGLERMGAALTELLRPLADEVTLQASQPAVQVDITGEAITENYGAMVMAGKRPDAPVQVLLAGHQDTVFAADHHFQAPEDLGDGRLRGPGVTDMKGGIVVMLAALEAFETFAGENPLGERLGWRVLLNADEETGSHGSAAALEAAAGKAHVGLVFEPVMADGAFSRARKGSGNFTLVCRGLAAHAGREFEKGRNAIVALAETAAELAGLSDPARGITVNIGRMQGGDALNVVPDLAVCQFNARCHEAETMAATAARIEAVVAEANQRDGIVMELQGGFTRPPKPVTAASQQLMDWTAECGRSLGIEVRFADTGGCCDGNNLAAAGLANVDTLGVRGAGIHTDQEFMVKDSLVERATLSYLLLRKLAAEGERLAEQRRAAG